jgi:hypothetical protein
LAIGGGWFCGIFLALLSAATIPVLLADVPPLVDYPNHLARMYLLGHLSESGSLKDYYAVNWALIPDLAMDLVVPAVARVLPLAWAAKLFLLATLALIAAGTAGVHRSANGRWTLWPLGAFWFLYSRVLLWGFLNFLFGVGLALTGLAAWIALTERPAWLRLAVGASFALGIFFAHLMAALVFGVLIGGYELGRWMRLRPLSWRAILARAALVGLAFAAPATLFLIGPHEGLGTIRFSRWVRKLDLPFSVFDDYHRAFDIGCFVLLVLMAGFLFARRYLVAMTPLRLPLLLLLLLYLAAPTQIMTASAVDHRLPLVLALVLVAATAAPTMPARWARGAAMVALALFAARLALVGEAWLRADAVYRRDVSVLDRIPEGARVALAYPPSAIAVDLAPKAHLPLLAVIRRDAFVPTLFAYPGQQPVALTPLGARLAAEAEPGALWRAWSTADAGAMTEALRDFDFFIALDRRPLGLPALTALEPVASEPDFALYRVRRGSP